MSELKFTIITRIYNTEKYLSQSIESVLAQNYSNWELILVNDGSSDNSDTICREYVRRDSRIKYIEQENLGGAKAQLAGFRAASGDYIFTLDSDDSFERGTLSFCHDKIIDNPDIDILLFGMNQYSENWKFIQHQPFVEKDTFFDKTGFINYVLRTTIHGLIKVLKRNLVEYTEWEYNYFYKNGSYFSLNNDILIGFPTLLKAKKALVIPQCFYNYRILENSSSHIDRPYKKIDVAFRTYDYLMVLFSNSSLLTDDIYTLVLYEVAREIVNSIRSIIKNRNYDKKRIIAIKSDKRFEIIANALRTKKISMYFSIAQRLLFFVFYRYIYHQNFNIHIISDSPYSVKFIEEVEKTFPTIINKYYCIDKSFRYLKCREGDDIVWSRTPLVLVLKLLFLLNRRCVKTVYLHYLDMKKTLLALFIFTRKEVVWGYWGGDLYNYIDYDLFDAETLKIYKPKKDTSHIDRFIFQTLKKFRTFVVNNKIDYITMKLPNEFDLLKHYYPKNNIKCIDFEYQNPIAFTDNEHLHVAKKGRISILLGNSGDPANNHISVIRKLAGLNIPFDVFCPLSYGNADYIRKVIEIGETELKEKFKPLVSFMEPKEYQTFLASIDIAIMNHYRQQGLGNIRFLIENGTKVFLNRKNPLYSYFLNEGLEINDIDEISDAVLKKELSNNQIEENKKIIKSLFSEAYYAKAMKTLFMMKNET